MTPIYLDYNATAPLRPQVIVRMQELLGGPFNPSSAHRFGREAKKQLEQARKTIADAVAAWPGEITFTASGTEANATALRGIAGRRVLVSAVEHSSVLSSPSPPAGEGRGGGALTMNSGLSQLSAPPHPNPPPQGGREYIPVTPSGIINLTALDALLAASPPALVSVMLANNETGVIQPVAEVAALCKKHGALLHCDAVQGLGKIAVDFGLLGADMMSISAHKCGGPLGAAALVVRRDLAFTPLLAGGGQELGRRAGTENVAAIAGFAAAVELVDLEQMRMLRGWLDAMESALLPSPLGRGKGEGPSTSESLLNGPHPGPLPGGEGAVIFGACAPRLPNTSCIAMPGVSNEVQLMDFDLKGFAVSAGSACSSGRIEGSHVLAAMGVEKTLAASAIRISGGWQTSKEEIILFTEAWKQTCKRLKKP